MSTTTIQIRLSISTIVCSLICMRNEGNCSRDRKSTIERMRRFFCSCYWWPSTLFLLCSDVSSEIENWFSLEDDRAVIVRDVIVDNKRLRSVFTSVYHSINKKKKKLDQFSFSLTSRRFFSSLFETKDNSLMPTNRWTADDVMNPHLMTESIYSKALSNAWSAIDKRVQRIFSAARRPGEQQEQT